MRSVIYRGGAEWDAGCGSWRGWEPGIPGIAWPPGGGPPEQGVASEDGCLMNYRQRRILAPRGDAGEF